MDEFYFPASRQWVGSKETVTAFRPDATSDPVYMADSSHPNWEEIIYGLRVGDPAVWDLFDVAGGVMRRFEQVTDRVSWNGSEILWDGDPLHSVLSEQLSRAVQEGNVENYTALAKFWEKLESNPDEHSREQAYQFLATHAFQITPEGDVVGYKGVSTTYNDEGEVVYRSGWSSTVKAVPSAYVNGQPVPPLSTVPQDIGDVVTMPRSEVVHDPSRACERGLHVATRDYAGGYGTVLEVHVNPRDIVSVPTDGGGAKVRVCRYKVAAVAGQAREGTVLRESNAPVWAGDVSTRV